MLKEVQATIVVMQDLGEILELTKECWKMNNKIH